MDSFSSKRQLQVRSPSVQEAIPSGWHQRRTSRQPAAQYPPRTLPKALLSLSLCRGHCNRRHHGPGHPKTLTSANPPIQGVHIGVAFTAQANALRPLRWEVHKLPAYKTTCTRLPRDGEFARVGKRERRRARRQHQQLIVELMQGKIATTW